jgi:AcrR family transcriptional regulator
MADIFAESGLSAGSVYSNFQSKAEIGAYVARVASRVRSESLLAYVDERSAAEEPATPTDIVQFVLAELALDRESFSALMQLWGESTVDPVIRTAIHEGVQSLHASLSAAILPWASRRADAAAVVARDPDELATAMLVLINGFVTRSAMLGPIDPGRYLETVRSVLAQ